jgi:hypothetical protein
VCHHPLGLVLTGTAGHLWFLSSLLICAAVCTCFLMMRQVVWLMVASTVLYIAGVLSSASSGYMLSTMKTNRSWLWKGWMTLVFGLALHLSELLFLRYRFGIISLPDYVFGTYFMGIGCSLIALSARATTAIPNALSPWSRSATAIGQFTLGVYVIHGILLINLNHFRTRFPVSFWDVGITPTLYILSLLIVFVMSKNRFLRPIVI